MAGRVLHICALQFRIHVHMYTGLIPGAIEPLLLVLALMDDSCNIIVPHCTAQQYCTRT